MLAFVLSLSKRFANAQDFFGLLDLSIRSDELKRQIAWRKVAHKLALGRSKSK